MYVDTSYVIQYLAGTSLNTDEVDRYGEMAAAIPALAHDLCESFSALQEGYLLLDSYYRGDPPLAREPDRLTAEYRELLIMARSNWCQLVVDVVAERLRIGSVASTEYPVQDPTAWQWWTANNMDGLSDQVQTAALKYGICYLSGWPRTAGRHAGIPKMMGESPLSSYVRFDPETGEAIAAIRLWQSCCGKDLYCDLTTPAAQYHLISRNPPKAGVRAAWKGSYPHMALRVDPTTVEWMFRDPLDTNPIEINPMGVVPYEAMYCMPNLDGGYRSEMEVILPIQDRINKTTFDRLVTQEFAAFPQRAIAGIETFRDPVTGEVKLPFDAAADRVWTAMDKDTKFIQFEAATGQAYLDANTQDIQALATESRTPPHYLMAGMGSFPSGESVRATEFGLSRKVQNRQQSFGDCYQKFFNLCGLIAGDERITTDDGINVKWKDMEARSEGEIVDALLKMATLGVPWRALWARWGATPEEMDSWSENLDETLERAQLFAAATTGPTATTTKIQTRLAPSTTAPPGGIDQNESTPV